MKVLLIQPPMIHPRIMIAPNIGLAYIAAVLEEEGVEVKVVDAEAEGIRINEVIERIREFKPQLIGAGGQTCVSPRSLTIFRRAKREVDPGIVTLAGGPHFTFTGEGSLEECPELDIVVRGEGEETIREVCQKINAGKDLEGVKGITYRNRSGKIVCNPDRESIPDLDSIPFPAWHLFPVEKYHWVGNKIIGISSSRGCPYRCPGCTTPNVHKGVRLRDPKKIVEEMVWVKKNFNHDTFFFHDDNSFLTREQMEGFLDELEKCGEKLYWYYETREDTLYEYRDMWTRMKENGMFKVVFGLETPNPKIRERYLGKKGFDRVLVDEMIDTLEKELDILVSVYLIFGMPGETEESMEATIDYGKYLYPGRCSFVVGSIFVPYPGTEVFRELKAKDMITSFDWKDYGFGKTVIKTSIPPERFKGIFTHFWTWTYVRPKVFLKQLEFFFSKNRFRSAMAKQYVYMAFDNIRLRGKLDSGS